MDKRVSNALSLPTRKAWREWVMQNHASRNEVLLSIYNRAPNNAEFSNRDAIEEALCFGWVDGWYKPIDSERWAIRYTPRRRGSSWSDYNIARAWKLINEKKMTPTGFAKLPPEVIRVWREFSPRPMEVNPRNKVIRFVNEDVDYLSKVKRPALTP